MRVAIVGAGLAGLAAAYELIRSGAAVTVLEASGRLGGQVHSEMDAGFLIEHGAEGFVPSREVAQLLATLRLVDRLIPLAATGTLGLDPTTGSLRDLQPGEAAELLELRAGDMEHRKGIVTLRGGTGELVTALAGPIRNRAEIRRSSPVTRIQPERTSWRIQTQDRNHVAADAVLVAVPAPQAACLLSPLERGAEQLLEALPTLPSVTVSLAFLRSKVAHPLTASGLVVVGPPREAAGLKACTFASSKFPGRAPRGWVQLRAFYRPGPGHELESSDRMWIERAVRDLHPVLGIAGQPARAWVSRWPQALPRYGPDHVARSHDLAHKLRGLGAIELAGAAFHGVGIGPALRSGHQAAQRLVSG